MIVSFIGMDGTGKTKHSLHVYQVLRDKGLRVMYIHFFAYKLLNIPLMVLKKLGSFVVPDQKDQSIKVVKAARKTVLTRLILSIFALIDFIITYKTELRPFSRESIVICDRYFYDELAKFIHIGICGRCIAKLHLCFIPKPDVIFLLDAPPDTTYGRKRELTINLLAQRREIYLGLAKWIKPIIIDTSKAFPETSQLIIEKITESFNG